MCMYLQFSATLKFWEWQNNTRWYSVLILIAGVKKIASQKL
jgi:hypothetical protein